MSTVTPPVKLQTSSYLVTGDFPIVDQSQLQFCGWTNETAAVIEEALPLIVFGDHTCVLKLVYRPFAQGADGIKILQTGAEVNVEFLFHSLSHHPLQAEDYKRHFSALRERRIFFPGIESGEQQKIAKCLTSLDDVIAAQAQKGEALRAHKRALMQQLFPREGETVPRLRFREFRGGEHWTLVPLGELLKGKPQYGVNEPAVPYAADLPTYLRITDIDEDGRFITEGKASVDITATEDDCLREGDIVFARTGASVGKSYRYRPEDGELVFAGFLIRVRPDQRKLLPAFLSSFLTTGRYWKWIRATSARSGQPGVNGTEYAALPIPIPSQGADPNKLAEQQKIADCLDALQSQITLASEKLNCLRRHKQALLQQLFPRPEALA